MNEFPHLLPVYPNFVSEIYLYRLLCGDAPEAVREMNKVLLEFFSRRPRVARSLSCCG